MYEATRQRTATTALRLFTVNLLKVLLVLTLIEYTRTGLLQQQHQQRRQGVSAARVKGLIYNKDGKFIYRPSRSNQAHIIVIDDRSPAKSSSAAAAAAGKHQAAAGDESSSASSNRSHADLQRPAASSFAPSPIGLQVYGPQQALYLQQQQHQAALSAVAAAAQLRGYYTPAAAAAAAAFPLVSLSDLPPTAGGQMAAASQAGGRLLQAAVLPPNLSREQQQQQMLASLQFVSSPRLPASADTYGYGPGYASQLDAYAGDPMEAYQPQGRATSAGAYDGLPAASYHSMPVIGRPRALAYEQSQYAEGQMYDQAGMRSDQQQAPPQDMSPFDEPPPAQQQQPGAYPGGPMPQRGRESPYGKSRRASQAVQDLDDAEGDHVDYYDAELREQRGRAGAMPSYDRGAHRQYVRPPPQPIQPMQSVVDEGGQQGGASVGPPRDYNDHQPGLSRAMSEHQTPIPGSIQSIKTQLRRSSSPSGGGGGSSGKSKQKQSGAGGQLPRAAMSLAAPHDQNGQQQQQPPPQMDNMAGPGGPAGGAAGKEPKSMQYWKQYQDQFDIVK